MGVAAVVGRLRLWTAVGDGGADFPTVRLRDAQLRQGQGRARAIGVPVTRWRGWKRRQRRQIVTPVERGVRADDLDCLAHRHADAAAFNDDTVFETTDQPHSGRLLNHDETQALMSGRWRRRPFHFGRPGEIVCMRPMGGFHACGLSNFADTPNIVASAMASVTYDFDRQVDCKVSRRRNYTVHLR